MSRPQKSALYDAVACVLSCCLQADSETQRMAQERKKALEIIDEYPLILTEIMGSEEEAIPERHMASVFLKNYLEEVYLGVRDVSLLHAKSLSKRLCLNLLDIVQLKLYNLKFMSGCCLSLLAAMDMWNFVNPRLMALLKSPNVDEIYTGVIVSKQIIVGKFFEDNENFQVETYYFDLLLDIFKMANLVTEARYSTVAPMFVLMKYGKDAENFIPSSLSKLGEVFDGALQEPFSQTADFKFKCEIIKCLYHCGENFGNISSSVISPALPHIGQLLTYCCEQYKNLVKNIEIIQPDPTKSSNVEQENFFELITWILEFIKSLIDLMYFDVLLDDLDNLLYSLFVFMSCHTNMETELYTEESDKGKYFIIRNVCSEIIMEVLKKIEFHRRKGREIFYKSLSNVFQKLLQEIQEERNNFPIYFVRVTESLMYGLGISAKYFDSSHTAFPINNFVENWTSLVRAEPNVVLNGRLLWLGAKYITHLSPAIFDIHLKAVLANCNNSEKYLYTPSLEALKNYLQNFRKMTPNQYIITSFSKEIIMCLLNMSQKVYGSPVPYLNSFEYFIECQPQTAAEHIDAVQDIILRAIYFSSSVPVMRAVGFIIRKLAKVESIRQPVLNKLLTILLSIVHLNIPKEFRDPAGAPEKALDFLNTFVLYSTIPFSDMFLLQAFSGAARLIEKQTPPTFNCYKEAAGNFIITLITKYTSQIRYPCDDKNKQIVEYLPKLIEIMLHPECVMPGHVFGKLVVIIIFSMPEIMEPHFEQILRNVITTNCDNFPNLRATWLIFLFICMYRPSNTINYLTFLPGPSGGSALNYLLTMWLPVYNKEVERIERQIMVLAITSIIQHCLEYEDEFKKMIDARVPFNMYNGDEKTVHILNGLEYMYFLAISFLFYEKKLAEDSLNKTLDDYPEDDVEKRDEDNRVLFTHHPLNIDIITHISDFLKKGCEPYFMVIKRLFNRQDIFILKEFGCAVPDVIQEEAME